jgi:hypothetical protein
MQAFADKDFDVENSAKAGNEYLEYQIKFYSALMGVLAIVCGFSSIIQKVSFGLLGENTTFEMRRVLY